MARPHRTAVDSLELEELVKLYFEAHPEKKARNDPLNRAHGTEALWLTPSDIPGLVDWARKLEYINTEQGQCLMTMAQRMENQDRNAEG
jgi:hypothetical protein